MKLKTKIVSIVLATTLLIGSGIVNLSLVRKLTNNLT